MKDHSANNLGMEDIDLEEGIDVEMQGIPLTLQELINVIVKDPSSVLLEDLVDYAINKRSHEINTSYFPGHKHLLHLVAEYEDYKNENDSLFEELLKIKSLNYDIQDDNGETPLHYAVKKGDLRNVEALMKVGANINTETNNRCNIIDYAIYYNRHDIIEYMIKRGENFQDFNLQLINDEKIKSLIKVAQFADKVYLNLIQPTESDYKYYAEYVNLIHNRIWAFNDKGLRSASDEFVGSVLKKLEEVRLQEISETFWVERVSQSNVNQNTQRGI